MRGGVSCAILQGLISASFIPANTRMGATMKIKWVGLAVLISSIFVVVLVQITPEASKMEDDWLQPCRDASDLAQQPNYNPDKLIELSNQCLEYNESEGVRVYAYVYLCIGHAEKGDLDRAISDCSKAIELDPEYVFPYVTRGVMRNEKGNWDGAIADFSKATELDPAFESLYFNLGHTHYKKGDLDKAIANYNKAIELNPTDSAAYNGLAWILATSPDEKRHDGKRAVELAEKGMELEANACNLDTLAAAYARAGRFQDAVETEQRAIEKRKEEKADQSIIDEYQSRLYLYKQDKPYVEE